MRCNSSLNITKLTNVLLWGGKAKECLIGTEGVIRKVLLQ